MIMYFDFLLASKYTTKYCYNIFLMLTKYKFNIFKYVFDIWQQEIYQTTSDKNCFGFAEMLNK